VLVADGTVLKAGGLSITVIHTPGHTQGGVCLYLGKEGVLFTGDTLFAGSVGRTDLPGGSHEALIKSIREKILPLGDDVRVLPGHGPETTIGEEKISNPFIMEG
jgi:glyoxylase-like metal-dependent hydrolase (beta-lactamase superfamily II)